MTSDDADAFEYYDDPAHREPAAGEAVAVPKRSRDMSRFASLRTRSKPSAHWLRPNA